MVLCPVVASFPVQVTELSSTPDGRLLACRLAWGGHSLTVVNTYWPQLPDDQRVMLDTAVRAAVTTARRGGLMLVGDFNHVPDAALDRTPLPGGRTHNSDRLAEEATAARLAALLRETGHQCADAYRERHGRTPGYTRGSSVEASRLDRCYLSVAVMPYMHACRVGEAGGSDHWPVRVSLLPVLPPAPQGAGPWRACPAFLETAALRASLEQWAAHAVHLGMALDPAALIRWWPTMKAAFRQYVRVLMRADAAAARAQPDEQAAAAALAAAREAAYAAGGAVQPEQLAAVAEAHSLLTQITRRRAHWATHRKHAAWLASREAPSPAVTRLVNPRTSSPPLMAVTQPDGELLTEPRGVAAAVARHFAGMSRAQPTRLDAQRTVFAAMEAQQEDGRARSLSPAAAAAAGAAVVTAEEVAAALRQLRAGKAPGPDGLPLEVWALPSGVWAPLLARLFTAMRQLGRMPRDFALGAVSPIYKGAGPLSAPASFRPITLLNADYKVLTRVLAARFGTALAGSVGPEQTAFLPDRDIADGIVMSQLLAAALAPDPRVAEQAAVAAGEGGEGAAAADAAAGPSPPAAVLLDIAKAYDTVDRGFLLAAMRAHGAGDDMVAWVELLLSDTQALAHVCGHASAPVRWLAGVRQGCPLSPLLYLFVAEALSCWLRWADGLGVEVAGRRYVSGHYADDTRVMLRTLNERSMADLLAHLAVFSAASGQHINASKSEAVPLGPWAAEGPGQLAGVPVRLAAKALGVQLAAVPLEPLVPVLRTGLRRRVREAPRPVPASVPQSWVPRIDKVRARCAMIAASPLSAMGCGMAVGAYALSMVLFHAQHEGLPQMAAEELQRVVSRAVDRPKRMPGVRGPLLCGSPALGGFGAVDVAAHTAARHAKRASCLLRGLCVAPVPPPPPLPPLPLAGDLPGGVEEGGPDPAAGPAPPAPPPLTLHADIAHAAGDVLRRVCPALHPAQVLLLSCYATAVDAAQGRLTGVQDQVLLLPAGPLRNVCIALQRLGPLVDNVPGGVRAWLSRPGMANAEVCGVVGALVWPGGRMGPCGEFSVREATALLMAPAMRQREAAHRAFAAQAFATAPVQLPQPQREQRAVSFTRALAIVWRLPWPNAYKEPLWRLAVNGVPGAGGHDIVHRAPCVCGFTAPRGHGDSSIHRQHAFWDCPVAAAVRGQLQRGLGQRCQLQQWQVWLLQKPGGAAVRPVVWRIVAAAALYAMDRGRASMWHAFRRGGQPAAAAQAAGCQRAAAEFWMALESFARDVMPDSARGWDAVGPDHPFLCVRVCVPGAAKLAVRLPG